MKDQELNDIIRLYERFTRQCPNSEQYTQRLAEETNIILQLRFVDYFIQICDIMSLTRDITHMTRGSAGSSLVCYLLGITDVDPIEWDTPQFQYRKYGWWSGKKFLDGLYVKELYMDRVEFAGLVANGRIFRGDRGQYITFVTLGVGNGQYIDVTIKRPVSLHDQDVIWGQGTVRHANNSDYIECYDAKSFVLESFTKS